MNVLMAVITDLWEFALQPLVKQSDKRLSSVDEFEQHIKNASTRLQSSTSTAARIVESSTAEVISGTVWVIAAAPVYVRPTYEIDTKIATIPFGVRIEAETSSGGWVKIHHEGTEGWVPAATISQDPHSIKAEFLDGDPVDATNSNVQIVRTVIKDEFSAAAISPRLLDIEYVLYRLYQQNRRPVWPSDRPRLAGSWQHLLKGKTGVHISIKPVTDSVVEFDDPFGAKNIGYVSAVYPDLRIKVEGIYGEDKSVFKSQEFTQYQWREWRPVFISIQ